MNRELQVHKIEPVIIEPDSAVVQRLAEQAQAAEGIKPFTESDSAWQIRLAHVKAGLCKIGLDVEAALTEEDDGTDFAVPNVTFEVRIGVEKVYEGKSDAKTGAFVARIVCNIPLDKVEPRFEVVVSARDEVGKLTMRVQVDVVSLLAELEENRRKLTLDIKKVSSVTKKEPEDQALKDRLVADEARKQTQIRAAIAKALRGIQDNKYADDREYVQRNREYEFRNLLAYRNHPIVKCEILKFAKENSVFVYNCASIYIDADWAEELVICCLELKGGGILQVFIDRFNDYSWIRRVLVKISRDYPGIIFNQFSLIEYYPWAKELILEAAKKSPREAIKCCVACQYQPWAREVALEVSSLNPEVVIECKFIDIDIPWAMEVLDSARANIDQQLAKKRAIEAEAAKRESDRWYREYRAKQDLARYALVKLEEKDPMYKIKKFFRSLLKRLKNLFNL